jgi:hypothetical protein
MGMAAALMAPVPRKRREAVRKKVRAIDGMNWLHSAVALLFKITPQIKGNKGFPELLIVNKLLVLIFRNRRLCNVPEIFI